MAPRKKPVDSVGVPLSLPKPVVKSGLPPTLEYLEKDLCFPLSMEELANLSGDGWVLCAFNKGRNGHIFMYTYVFHRPVQRGTASHAVVLKAYLLTRDMLIDFARAVASDDATDRDAVDLVTELMKTFGVDVPEMLS